MLPIQSRLTPLVLLCLQGVRVLLIFPEQLVGIRVLTTEVKPMVLS